MSEDNSTAINGRNSNSNGTINVRPSIFNTIGISKDNWIKILLWIIPIVFFAGAIYFSIQEMDVRVKGNSDNIKTFVEKQHEMTVKQSTQDVKLDMITENQKMLEKKVESVKDKLDDQKDDLSIIKAKLGVRERRN